MDFGACISCVKFDLAIKHVVVNVVPSQPSLIVSIELGPVSGEVVSSIGVLDAKVFVKDASSIAMNVVVLDDHMFGAFAVDFDTSTIDAVTLDATNNAMVYTTVRGPFQSGCRRGCR